MEAIVGNRETSGTEREIDTHRVEYRRREERERERERVCVCVCVLCVLCVVCEGVSE